MLPEGTSSILLVFDVLDNSKEMIRLACLSFRFRNTEVMKGFRFEEFSFLFFFNHLS